MKCNVKNAIHLVQEGFISHNLKLLQKVFVFFYQKYLKDTNEKNISITDIKLNKSIIINRNYAKHVKKESVITVQLA